MQTVDSVSTEQERSHRLLHLSREGFNLPIDISGAPQRITIPNLLQEIRELLTAARKVYFSENFNEYEQEIDRASWWRFWLMVGVAGIVAGVLFAIATIAVQVRLADFGLGVNVAEPLFTLIFTPVLVGISLYAGIYLSHWYLTAHHQERSETSFLRHAYTIAIAWLPGSILVSLIGAISTIFFGGFISVGFFMRGGTDIINALPVLVWLFSLFSVWANYRSLRIAEDGLGYTHRVSDIWLWVSLWLFVIVFNVVYLLLNVVVPG